MEWHRNIVHDPAYKKTCSRSSLCSFSLAIHHHTIIFQKHYTQLVSLLIPFRFQPFEGLHNLHTLLYPLPILFLTTGLSSPSSTIISSQQTNSTTSLETSTLLSTLYSLPRQQNKTNNNFFLKTLIMSSTLASRALFRAATRRQLSTARTIARSFEAHPYERMSKEKPASGAYGKMAKNAASRLVL